MKARDLYTNAATSDIRSLLNAALKSEAAFEKALTKIDAKAQGLYTLLQRFAPKALTEDDSPMSLHAEVTSEALGINTVAKAGLTATLVERPLYTIAVASAVSISAVDGGDELAFASSFTGAPGADFAYTKVKTITGANFKISVETMVAIDFSFLELPGRTLTREVNVLADRVRAEIGQGNVATADVELFASAENTAIVADTSVLTIEDFFSSSTISADLFLA